jgi:hypothetical protein
MTGFAVETSLLWQLIWVALVAGIGISVLFSLVIFGAARAGDARRARQGRTAVAYAALAVLAFALFAAGVVLGVQEMASK